MDLSLKFEKIAKCMDIWMQNRENNKSIGHYLRNKGVEKIGVYGYGILGRHLIFELKQAGLENVWITDRRDNINQNFYSFVNLLEGDFIPETELVIVTAVGNVEEIENILRNKVDCPIVSLEEIVGEMQYLK